MTETTSLSALRELLTKATDRPWVAQHVSSTPNTWMGPSEAGYTEGVTQPRGWVFRFDDDYGTDQHADAELIAQAVNALEGLLDVAEFARQAKDAYDLRRTNAIMRIGSGRDDEARLNLAINRLSAALAAVRLTENATSDKAGESTKGVSS